VNKLVKDKHHALQDDFDKYGITSFTFEILEVADNDISQKELYKLENKYINLYDSINNGYNQTITLVTDTGFKTLYNYEPKAQKLFFPSFKQIISKFETRYSITCKYNDIFKILRENNILYHDENKINKPYDEYLDRFFKVETKTVDDKTFTTLAVTPDGAKFLEEKLLEFGVLIHK
jgi:phage antirepressor YoqD-like protein